MTTAAKAVYALLAAASYWDIRRTNAADPELSNQAPLPDARNWDQVLH